MKYNLLAIDHYTASSSWEYAKMVVTIEEIPHWYDRLLFRSRQVRQYFSFMCTNGRADWQRMETGGDVKRTSTLFMFLHYSCMYLAPYHIEALAKYDKKKEEDKQKLLSNNNRFDNLQTS